MMAVEEGLHTRFDGNRSGWDKSHSTCVNLKKAHSLLFRVQGIGLPRLDAQEKAVARDPGPTRSNWLSLSLVAPIGKKFHFLDRHSVSFYDEPRSHISS